MRFDPTPLQGAYTIQPEPRGDSRGYFARLFCEREFAQAGLTGRFVQVNHSFNATKGTLRGMHYQLPPSAEAKLVVCLRGALHDVIVDLRPDSPTWRRSWGTELTAQNHRMLYIPRGFAHGFLTLAEDTEVLYLMSEFYAPELARGLRHDDPWLGLEWPGAPAEISEKDRNWPLFDPQVHGVELMRGLQEPLPA